jgi:hypothetical protein
MSENITDTLHGIDKKFFCMRIGIKLHKLQQRLMKNSFRLCRDRLVETSILSYQCLKPCQKPLKGRLQIPIS